MPFKQYIAIGLLLAVLAGGWWHKHVVGQRDAARAEVVQLTASRDAFKAALVQSEELRHKEAAVAKQALSDAQAAADARVAEARRSAAAIKKLVEKPRATTPANCPVVSDLVPADELRDALQPAPFVPGSPAAAEPGGVSAPAPRAGAALDGWDRTAPDAGFSGGERHLPELGLGGAGVGPGDGSGAGEASV